MNKLDAEQLRQMVAEDEWGLLDVPVKAAPMTGDDRLLAKFNEIVDFVTKHGREPDLGAKDVGEKMLAMRLKAIAGSDEQREALREFDAMGLLQEPEPPKTVAEVLEDDDFGLLDDGAELHNLKHVPKSQTMPQHIARRKPCDDFDDFKQLFVDCQRDLRSGARSLLEFRNPRQIEPGKFFVQNGVLLYVAAVGELTQDEIGKANARTRCIFENGTESDLLLQSLASNLYKDGRRVTEPNEVTLERMGLEPDTKMGCVYVLRSKSDDEQLSQFQSVHKIGSTSGTADKRVAGAEKHATFLNAPVEVVAEYRMPAAVVHAVEGMLHKFFSSARLDIWFEREGINVAEANEWFDVPLPVIDEAIELIQAETITSFAYDRDERRIVLS